jgi:SAM-dependent methyltransferase
MIGLDASLRARFDVVLCMGNSVPHITTPDHLPEVLRVFRGVTAPDGLVFVQTLNYDRILAKRERIVSIDRGPEQEFIRFYDFQDDGRIRFNVLTVRWATGREPVGYDLHGTLLYPYRNRELRDALERAGFAIEGLYGSPGMGPFDEHSSPTCLAVGRN